MANLKKISETEFILSGDLNFMTTAIIYEENLSIFENTTEHLNINLQGVQHVDSSGLALIVEWYRMVQKNNQRLTVSNMPTQMHDLA
ncbi:MAG: STAS domain-containing protein, partial [Pseudomonadota bacterium]